MRKIVVISLIFLSLASRISAQHFPERPLKTDSPLTMNVAISNFPADEHGTNVENMRVFTITINTRVQLHQKNFNLIYFLDGIHAQEIHNINFPYVFEQNYKGLSVGVHKVQFVVEDPATFDALAQSEVTFNVNN